MSDAHLADLLAASARQRPEAVAVIEGDRRWTYAEIDALGDRLAAAWAGRVAPGDRVAVWAEKSGRTIAALHAALRLGAAYVPIDPGAPRLRVDAVIADAAPALIATTPERLATLDDARAVSLEDEADGPPPAVAGGGDGLAYVLYTSGSTGVPKGVALTHDNALAFVRWAAPACALGPDDVVSSHAPLHFDLSIFDLYASFAVGAAVVIVPEADTFRPEALVDLVARHAVTVWYSVPSALILMMERGELLDRGASLRVVVFAGEVFPIRALARLRAAWPEVRLWNWYGPTETNVCTAHEQVGPIPDDASAPLPIGAAVAGDEARAVTEDGRVAGPGEEGELWVDGPTVMRGYFGRAPHEGPYRTGDVVQVVPEGFRYVGRRDLMVKLRGYRVELGDVEAALLAHPGVLEAVAVVAGEGAQARLVACCVPKAERVPLLAMKAHCATRVPRYMLPDGVRWIEALPRTSNGKADRVALRALAARPAEGA